MFAWQAPDSDVLFTPNVKILRKAEKEGYGLVHKEIAMDVVSLAFPDLNKTRKSGDKFDRDLSEETLENSAKAAKAKSQTNVQVLVWGAAGCGSFQNDIVEVAKLQKNVFGRIPYYEEIAYAIPPGYTSMQTGESNIEMCDVIKHLAPEYEIVDEREDKDQHPLRISPRVVRLQITYFYENFKNLMKDIPPLPAHVDVDAESLKEFVDQNLKSMEELVNKILQRTKAYASLRQQEHQVFIQQLLHPCVTYHQKQATDIPEKGKPFQWQDDLIKFLQQWVTDSESQKQPKGNQGQHNFNPGPVSMKVRNSLLKSQSNSIALIFEWHFSFVGFLPPAPYIFAFGLGSKRGVRGGQDVTIARALAVSTTRSCRN